MYLMCILLCGEMTDYSFFGESVFVHINLVMSVPGWVFVCVCACACVYTSGGNCEKSSNTEADWCFSVTTESRHQQSAHSSLRPLTSAGDWEPSNNIAAFPDLWCTALKVRVQILCNSLIWHQDNVIPCKYGVLWATFVNCKSTKYIISTQLDHMHTPTQSTWRNNVVCPTLLCNTWPQLLTVCVIH